MENFCKKISEINSSGSGWAGLYYGIYSKIINDNNFKKCAEVGIGYGFHAVELLRNTNLEQLYLIDPMEPYDSKDQFHVDVMNNGGFEQLVIQILNSLSKYKNRYTWFRKHSSKITNDEIPDGSLDAVFIDGNHSYEAVTSDLEIYWNKIRPGGYLLGDDYWMKSVSKAVDNFRNKHKLDINFYTKPDGSSNYKIFGFIKS